MTRLLILLTLLCGSITIAQTADDDSSGNSGIVYGRDHAFAVSAPNGWVLDNSSGISQGLHAVFYPKGGSWENSPAVMYVNTSSKSVKGNETLEELIAFDINQSYKENPTVKISDFPRLITKDKKPAIVKCFVYSSFEAVAYIDEETIISMICLTARTKVDFDESIKPFKELVASYYFLTKEVSLPK
jgi:hypothetical protein